MEEDRRSPAGNVIYGLLPGQLQCLSLPFVAAFNCRYICLPLLPFVDLSLTFVTAFGWPVTDLSHLSLTFHCLLTAFP